MLIKLLKFGTVLTSRQAGKEALAAFQPYLNEVAKNEAIDIEINDGISLSPSWADEFITPLMMKFGKKKVRFLYYNNNPSVKTTLEFLSSIKWNEIK